MTDAGSQCANGERCGEEVDGAAQCLPLDGGSPAPCVTDLGCFGGWRCDAQAKRCVEVDDVVAPGTLTNLRATRLSPLLDEGVPLRVASTNLTMISAFPELAVAFATLSDAGVLSMRTQSTQGSLRRNDVQLGIDPHTVTDVIVVDTGAVVRFTNGTVTAYPYNANTPTPKTNADSLFVAEDPAQQRVPRLGWISGSSVTIENVGSVTHPGPLRAAARWGDDVYGFTTDGRLSIMPLDGGTGTATPGAVLPAGTLALTMGVAASSNGRPAFFVTTGNTLVPWLPEGGSAWLTTSAPVQPCTDGGTLLQASFVEDGMQPALAVRCARASGPYASTLRFERGGPLPGGLRAKEQSLLDDLIPWTGPVLAQSTLSTGRAHAGANGKLWQAIDDQQQGNVGGKTLRSVVLDRQPDALLWVQNDQGPVFFASVANQVFNASSRDRNGSPTNPYGLVADLNPSNVVPLQTFSNRTRWVVATQGILDVVGRAGSPTMVAVLPTGIELTSPVSASVTTLGAREVVLLSSRDSIWAADVTGILGDPFAQPATLEPVVVPQPGVRLRSLTLLPTDGGVGGFVTTNTNTLEFRTDDLRSWSTSTVRAPTTAVPLEVWTQGTEGRVGTTDGIVWSLPIMVPLTQPLRRADGGALAANDFARKCGELFVTTADGLHRLVSAGAALPSWSPEPTVNAALDGFTSLRLYETRSDGGDQLYVATPTGQVTEIEGDGPCP